MDTHIDAAHNGPLNVLQKTGPASLNTIVGALVPATLVAAAYVCGFLTIRGTFRSQYAPRTFSQIIPEKDRTPSTSTSGSKWFKDYRQLDDTFVLRHHSFDAFLFLRFFRMLVLISVVGAVLTWPTLLPLNANGGGGATELDRLAFNNIVDPKYCWGTVVVAVIFLTFVILIVNRERLFIINMKQTYITTKASAERLSARVVLFLSVPPEIMNRDDFGGVFGEGIRRTWKVSKLNDLKKLVDDRNQKVYDLESAEITLAQNVLKQQNKIQSNGQTNGGSLERGDASVDHPQNRPVHRQPVLVGKKLDSIDHILSAVPDLTQKIDHLREKYTSDSTRHTGALFVEFKDQVEAYRAFQQIQHHDPLSLQPRFIGVSPSNVKWSSLALDPALRITYSHTAIALIIAITIFWSIPVGLVATITNIEYLANNFKWLSWINRLPDWLVGLISGYLPPTALSFLVSMVPYWFRDIAELSGEPTAQAAEEMTQRWFFVFQFLQVFLVTTLSSGAATIVRRVGEEPSKIPTFLANNLPKSANFYLTYFTLQGLSTSASLLIKYSDTFQYVFYKKLTNTPRQRYEQETKMKGLFYGYQYPKFTNLAVIAIVYSCIAPLVLGFAAIGFTLFYAAYRYLMLYTNNVRLEMRGSCHTRALQQLLTGVYVSELCLIGLFGARGAKGPSTIMIIFFVLTILHHYTVNKYLSPLEERVPLDILQAAEARNHESNDDNNNGGPEANTTGEGDAEEPLLSSTESRDARLIHHQNLSVSQSLPPRLLDPLKSILENYSILPSIAVLRPYILPSNASNVDLRESSLTTVTKYTDAQIKNAYLHPALTSKPPLVWLAKDPAGVSEEFKRRNKERADLETSDEAAELDEQGNLHWDESDLSKAPIFKLPTRY
ncbi:hypothetical protein LTR64_006790 [Lithohypha guttulata]|uniref:uncharacterized protein n=1 Tax=Lithohypha guttulata TaxID=1690604 RepID=UPI002DE09B8E|nr:hypothetical protein LTR51_004652 [Lithohypha guttulata]